MSSTPSAGTNTAPTVTPTTTRSTSGSVVPVAPKGPGRPFEKFVRVYDEIPGWIEDGSIATWDSLLEFQRERGVRGPMLEIGVLHGKSAALLALHSEPHQRLYLVDFNFRHEEVEAAMAKVEPDPRVEIMTMAGDSTDLHISPLLAEQFRKVRFIHIDGEHSARAVTSDMAAAAQMLSKDGVLVIDDFFNWTYPQVTEAVFRFLRNHPDDFAMFLAGFNKAYLARPQFVHEYLHFCATRLPEEIETRGLEVSLTKTSHPAEMNVFGLVPRVPGKPRRGMDHPPGAFPY